MAEQKKSMDDVLASIRKIIKTDPNAAPPDASTLPPAMDSNDDTAASVLQKLRKEHEDDDKKPVKALSGTTDDPEETANAVLERLRRDAEKELKSRDAAPETKAAPEPEKPRAEKPKTVAPEPDLEETPEEPPAVAADSDGVPDLDDEEPLELGANTGARVLDPQGEDEDEPESGSDATLPQPAEPAPSPVAAEEAGEPAIMLDEAALEDTIRRIVRDELTGDMGRRMTKNVQRMIETEVKRILAELEKD